MSASEFAIRGEFIELQQFLKAIGVIDLGSKARGFLQENEVRVNGEPEARRGRKLRPGDSVALPDGSTWTLTTA